MNIKMIMRIYNKFNEMTTMKNTDSTEVLRLCETTENPIVADGYISSGITTLEKHLIVSYIVKYLITMLSTNSTPRYLFMTNEIMSPHKDFYTDLFIRILFSNTK